MIFCIDDIGMIFQKPVEALFILSLQRNISREGAGLAEKIV